MNKLEQTVEITHFAFRACLDDLTVSQILTRYIKRSGIEPVWYNNGTKHSDYDNQKMGKWREVKLLPTIYKKALKT